MVANVRIFRYLSAGTVLKVTALPATVILSLVTGCQIILP